MDFLTLNFGQLLHLLDNEIKNKIRNLEKQNKNKLYQLKIAFFLTKYIYLYIYIWLKSIEILSQN